MKPTLVSLTTALTLLTLSPATAQPAICMNRDFNVYFDEWKSDLTPEARETIAVVQHDLQGCVIGRVRIIGLAGARGNDVDNLNVSMARAQAIAAALAQGGWPADHFEVVALGEQNAMDDEGTARPMRRRASVSVQAAPPAP
jgi:outer membrane protein OmpA-like peptidoglycan-associated protein